MYNRSVRIMYDLPWATHRFLIGPLTGDQHVSRILVKRYLAFIEKIKKSGKATLKQLLEVVKTDVRFTTPALLEQGFPATISIKYS